MADNFDVTAGSGTTIRAIEKSSKKSQVVVLDLGGAGAESLATTTIPVSEATLDASVVTQGTTAPTKVLVSGGKTNDGTAQYRETPLGAGGRSVIVEGYTGGTAVPITNSGVTWTSVFGVSGAAVVSADATTAVAVSDLPTTGQKIVVDGVLVSTDTAMSIFIEEETSGTDVAKFFLAANSSFYYKPTNKIKLATVNKKLTARASVSGNIAVTAEYHSEA